jgi:hypothetical protein
VTRRAWRRFRFALFGFLWLGGAAFQSYVSDIGTHGVAVGGYLPDWLLGVAKIPPWTLFIAVGLNLLFALLAMRLPDYALRVLALINSALLVLYAAIGLAVLYYIAFANSGIS